ncbi:MAG: hypothetical protein KAR20_24660, partial [Candidatus Heimdallarchaeota archaeon]|nr:hypothetical protein [Candidatus Heimdallarchaeota archaeon]
MHGKIYRFIFIETRFKLQFIAFLAIILVSLVEISTIYVLNRNIAEGEVRKALIVCIAEMESILYPGSNPSTMITKQTIEPVKIGNEFYSLKGVRELEGRPSALINDDVYQQDELIKDYLITK